MNRRKMLIATAASALVAPAATGLHAGAARAQAQTIFPDDRILGPADAPITIIEYASLTCPHCAALHREALPEIKETWIAEGTARLVFRHFPLDALALRAAAVTNCIEGERFFGFLDLLFKSQQRWAKSKEPLKVLGQMARLAGMSQEKFDACVSDEAEMDRILERRQDGMRTYDVRSTPTLIINGRKVEGTRDFDYLEKIFKEIVPES
ncbi:MAG: DsbA family protein [Proteobacteria bacterium]|nr:DsbA family protein [Pseudomonadota bacterium]